MERGKGDFPDPQTLLIGCGASMELIQSTGFYDKDKDSSNNRNSPLLLSDNSSNTEDCKLKNNSSSTLSMLISPRTPKRTILTGIRGKKRKEDEEENDISYSDDSHRGRERIDSQSSRKSQNSREPSTDNEDIRPMRTIRQQRGGVTRAESHPSFTVRI